MTRKNSRNVEKTRKKHSRFGFGAAFALLLVFLLALSTGTAAAQTDITGCSSIQTSGSYEITNDIDTPTGFCIDVAVDDVVIDGNGNRINNTGSGNVGLNVQPLGLITPTNVTIENLTLSNFGTGVKIENSEDVTLTNINTDSTSTAILVEESPDVTVEGATISDTDVGVDVQKSDDVTVRDSSLLSTPFEIPDFDDPIDDPPFDDPFDDPLDPFGSSSIETQSSHDAERGIFLNETQDAVVEDNVVSNFEEQGIAVSVGQTDSSGSNEVVDNEVVNNTQGIFVASAGGTIPPNQIVDNEARANGVGIGVFGRSPSPRNQFSRNELRDNGNGIFLLSEDEDVTDNTVVNSSGIGIGLASEDADVSGNQVRESGDAGIQVQEGSLNSITDNVVEDNGEAGIHLGGAAGSDVDNNTLVNNTATGDQTYGIWLFETDDNELRENTANENTNTGIYLNRTSTGNEIRDNVANDNGRAGPPMFGTYGIWLEEGSNDNEVVGNEAFDNGIGGGSSTPSAGIYLGGGAPIGPPVAVENNEVVDNTVSSTPSGSQSYGIWLVGANENRLEDNVAENNDEAGVYLGGTAGAIEVRNNTLVNNTARGSEYGVWLVNAYDNDVSESLAENNHEGIAVEEEPLLLSEDVETESVSGTGNTFTDDVSRDNDWDFVIDSLDITPISTSATASDHPVTNLSIGESTAPETTLSFGARDVRLRAVDAPESDPDDLENIGRYFNASELSVDAYLDVSLRYEDGDVAGVNESMLELQRYVSTEWVSVPDSSVDTDANTLSANLTDFATSEFGVFGEAGIESPVDGVSDELWAAVTGQDGNEGLSLADLGDAIQAYQANPSDADVGGVSITLSDLGDLIQYYRNVVV